MPNVRQLIRFQHMKKQNTCIDNWVEFFTECKDRQNESPSLELIYEYITNDPVLWDHIQTSMERVFDLYKVKKGSPIARESWLKRIDPSYVPGFLEYTPFEIYPIELTDLIGKVLDKARLKYHQNSPFKPAFYPYLAPLGKQIYKDLYKEYMIRLNAVPACA